MASEVWKRDDRMEERAWKSDSTSMSFGVQANRKSQPDGGDRKWGLETFIWELILLICKGEPWTWQVKGDNFGGQIVK